MSLTYSYYVFITSQHILLLLLFCHHSSLLLLLSHHFFYSYLTNSHHFSYSLLTTTTTHSSPLLSITHHHHSPPLLLLPFHSHLSYSFLTTHCRDADGTFQMTGVAELDNVCEALGLELSEEEMEVSAIVIRCCDKVVGMMWCFSCFCSCLLSMS